MYLFYDHTINGHLFLNMLDNYTEGNLPFTTEYPVRLIEEGLCNGHPFRQILCRRTSGSGVMVTERVYGSRPRDVQEISTRFKDFVASIPS